MVVSAIGCAGCCWLCTHGGSPDIADRWRLPTTGTSFAARDQGLPSAAATSVHSRSPQGLLLQITLLNLLKLPHCNIQPLPAVDKGLNSQSSLLIIFIATSIECCFVLFVLKLPVWCSCHWLWSMPQGASKPCRLCTRCSTRRLWTPLLCSRHCHV